MNLDKSGQSYDSVTHPEQFKDNDLEKLPKEWELSSLAAIALNGISNGFFKRPEAVGSGFRLINVSDLYQDFGINLGMVERVKAPQQALRKYAVLPGDCFFTRSSLNLIGIAQCNAILNMTEPALFEYHLMRVRPNQAKINPVFLAHWCRSPFARKFFMRRAKQVTMITISQPDIASLPISLPSLREQENIVAILSAIDTTIVQTEQFIAKLKQTQIGLQHDLLTCGLDEHGQMRDPIAHPEMFKDTELGRIPKEWEICPIEDKLHRIIDYPGKTPHKNNTGVPLIAARNVRKGFLDIRSIEYIKESDYDKWMNRGIPSVGDVLFTIEAPLGNVAQIPDYKVALSQRILTLCANLEVLDKKFLLWLLLWENTQKIFREKSTGSTVVGIKQSVFRKVKLQFPPLREQIAIDKVLHQYKVHLQSEEGFLAKLKQLKKGLMDDLLTGRVRVKIDED